MIYVARIALVALSLGVWFLTQRWIARRPMSADRIGDRVHDWTASLNRYFNDHPRRANGVLIATSALIDALGVYLLASAIFGPTLRPFIGLLVLFALRQITQGLVALPVPPGMIWRRPGFPSLLVTYDTANDFFFSGHTAIAVYGAVELGRTGIPALAAAGVAVALLEATTVLVLRAHWTADVFTGLLAALGAAWVAPRIAPFVDVWLRSL